METIKTILENLAYASTIALTYFAYKGLEQIKIARNSHNLNSKRDSFKTAAEQCNLFKDDTIPCARKLLEEIKKNEIDYFQAFEKKIDGDTININPKRKIIEKDFDKLEAIEDQMIKTFNSMEGFALYFTSGIAEDKIGYSATGSAFCEMVEEFLPILVVYFEKDSYKNISRLFIHWHKQLKTDQILSEREDLDKELKKNQTIKIKSISEI